MKTTLLSVLFLIGCFCSSSHAQIFQWGHTFGAAQSDFSTDLYVDLEGNVYHIGTFRDSVDFDPGPNSAYLSAQKYADIFIQKLDSSGNFLWAKSFQGTASEAAISIVVDANQNIYLAGIFNDTFDLDPGPAVQMVVSNYGFDVFVLKLDASGNLLWARNFGSNSDHEECNTLALDDSSNVYIAGSYAGSVDFNPGGTAQILSNIGYREMYLNKLDSNGNFIWVKGFPGGAFTTANEMGIDSNGDILMVGHFIGTVDFDPSAATYNLSTVNREAAFALKLSRNGSFIWAKNLASYGSIGSRAHGMAIGNANELYVTGYFGDTTDFDPSASVFNLISAGGGDAFIWSLNSGGSFNWAKSLGGADYVIGEDMVVDALGNLYVIGKYSGTADLNPGAATASFSSNGGNDIFIQKLDASGNFIWASSMGDSLNDSPARLFVDTRNNLYATGSYQVGIDLDPRSSVQYYPSAGEYDMFLLKLGTNALPLPIVEMPNSAMQVRLYPNPAHEYSQLELRLEQAKDIRIELINLQGQLLWATEEAQVLEQVYSIEIGTLPAGVYVLRVLAGTEQTTYRLVVR